MISKYWKPVHIFDWYDRLSEAEKRAGTDKFSIVYRFYSTKNGKVRYAGRSDSPYNRLNGHIFQIVDCGMHDFLGSRVTMVDFRYYTGSSHFEKAYEEECKQWHIHDPDLNDRHPHRKYNSWKCPICKKQNSHFHTI